MISLILSTWECAFFLFHWSQNERGGLEVEEEGIGVSLGGVESLIDSLSFGSSTSFERIESMGVETTTSPLRGEGEEDEGKGFHSHFAHPPGC